MLWFIPSDKPEGKRGTASTIRIDSDLVFHHSKGLFSNDLRLNLFRPDDAQIHPLVILIHGGGWAMGSRSDFDSFARALSRNGLAAATIDYRLAPRHHYPSAEVDVMRAIVWAVRNAGNFGFNAERIALVGGSSGGHLALLGAYKSLVPIKAVVDVAGPTDLQRIPPEYGFIWKLVTGFMDGLPGEAPELYARANPLNFITAASPPTLILHGDADNVVPYSQSLLLDARLTAAGVEHRLITVEGGGHDFLAKGDNARLMNETAVEFLRSHLTR